MVDLHRLALFLAAALVLAITPGPGIFYVLARTLAGGRREGIHSSLGTFIGGLFHVFAAALGVSAILAASAVAFHTVKYAGAAYLLYLAWAIGTSRKIEEGKKKSRPLTFLEGAAFQWINAKGWIIALGAITTYAALISFPQNVILLSALFAVMGTASSAAWAAFGSGLRRFLKDGRQVRAFNIVMALLLVASLIPVFAEAWH